MDLTAWLRRYLSTHPLKESTNLDRSQYTAEVMTRIRSLDARAARPAAQPWLPWPRFALAAAAAAAVVFVMVGRAPNTQRTVAQDVEQDLELLAVLDEDLIESPEPAELAEELETLDTLVLAEAQPSDETWVLETLLLLEEVGVEDAPAADGVDDDQWFQDLELLDELDLSTTS